MIPAVMKEKERYPVIWWSIEDKYINKVFLKHYFPPIVASSGLQKITSSYINEFIILSYFRIVISNTAVLRSLYLYLVVA